MASPNSRCKNLFILIFRHGNFISRLLNWLLLNWFSVVFFLLLQPTTARMVTSKWFVFDVSEFVAWHVFWLYFDFFENLIKLTFIITKVDPTAIAIVVHLKDPIALPAPPVSFIFNFFLFFYFRFGLLNWPLVRFLFLFRFSFIRGLFSRSIIIISTGLLLLILVVGPLFFLWLRLNRLFWSWLSIFLWSSVMLRCYNFRLLLSWRKVCEYRCLSTSLYVILELYQKVSHNIVVLSVNVDCFVVKVVALITKNTLLSMEHLAHSVALIVVASMNEYVKRSELLSNIFESPFIHALSTLLFLCFFTRSTFSVLVSFIFFSISSRSGGHCRDFFFLFLFRFGIIQLL